MWRLITNSLTYPITGKWLPPQGGKIRQNSKNISSQWENWNLLDFKALKASWIIATQQHQIWATLITSWEIPTGITVNDRRNWSTMDCPRGCVTPIENITNIFQCIKEDSLGGRLTKFLQKWVQRNQVYPQLLPTILNGISNYRKILTRPLPIQLTLILTNTFEKKTSIGWLWDLMGLLTHKWA